MPYLGSTVFFSTLVVALLVALTGWFLSLRALAPRFVARAHARWRQRPVITVLVGGVLGGLATVIALLLLSLGPGIARLAGTVVLVSALGVAVSGASGLASLVGEGLASPRDEGREWMRVLKGGVALELAFLLPLVGWLVLLPVALFGGIGAAVQSAIGPLFARRPSELEPDAAA